MMRQFGRRKKWIIAVAVVVVLLPLGYRALLVLGDYINDKLIDAIGFHETGATVIRKEIVKFDETNHSYLNDHGDRIEAQPGGSQYRVYYKYDEFNGYDERFTSKLMQFEERRLAEGNPHFAWKNYDDKSLYDTVQVGDKLIVTYRAYSDGYLEVVSVKVAER